MITNCHIHHLLPNQCGPNLMQTINAPVPLLWSILPRFDLPQAYKQFIKGCTMLSDNGSTGSVREVNPVSGLPATTSRERLEMRDDDLHTMVVSIVGSNHRLVNYHSTTTLYESEAGKTLVMESYVVDIPREVARRILASVTEKIVNSLLILLVIGLEIKQVLCANG